MQRTVKGEVIASTFDRLADDPRRSRSWPSSGRSGWSNSATTSSSCSTRSPASAGPPQPGRAGIRAHSLRRCRLLGPSIRRSGSSVPPATSRTVAPDDPRDGARRDGFQDGRGHLRGVQGMGNMGCVSRQLADRRIFPAVDVNLSGTRREEILLAPDCSRSCGSCAGCFRPSTRSRASSCCSTARGRPAAAIEFLVRSSRPVPSASVTRTTSSSPPTVPQSPACNSFVRCAAGLPLVSVTTPRPYADRAHPGRAAYVPRWSPGQVASRSMRTRIAGEPVLDEPACGRAHALGRREHIHGGDLRLLLEPAHDLIDATLGEPGRTVFREGRDIAEPADDSIGVGRAWWTLDHLADRARDRRPIDVRHGDVHQGLVRLTWSHRRAASCQGFAETVSVGAPMAAKTSGPGAMTEVRSCAVAGRMPGPGPVRAGCPPRWRGPPTPSEGAWDAGPRSGEASCSRSPRQYDCATERLGSLRKTSVASADFPASGGRPWPSGMPDPGTAFGWSYADLAHLSVGPVHGTRHPAQGLHLHA